MDKKKISIAAGVIILVGVLAWLFIESSKPLPGEKIAYNCDNYIDFSKFPDTNTSDKCRVHVPEGTKVDYKINPPVFGPHYASWITKGFYEEPRFDGNLVHSEEHGYVILWYDCENKGLGRGKGLVKSVYAHEDATPSANSSTDNSGVTSMTGGSEGRPSAHFENMPKSFSDGSCNNFKNELKSMLAKFGPHKLIIVPRPNLGQRLVLTAWGRVEKLNSVDETKIKKFIDTYRDFGPEATNEP